MGSAAITFPREAFDDKYLEMTDYLSSEGGYWLREDKWYMGDESFHDAGIKVPGKNKRMADFSGYESENLKMEMKYYLLFSVKEKHLTANGINRNYLRAIQNIGTHLGRKDVKSFEGLPDDGVPAGLGETEHRAYLSLYRRIVEFMMDYYDERSEFEKDVWHASRIPGARRSAAEKRLRHSMSFEEIPVYYREMTKRFMSRLIVRRSWSHCKEVLMYIRYFFKVFYEHGHGDGFFQELSRKDTEQYLGWVAADYGGKNATFRSKAVSFIRQFIDYIQLAEYEQAPHKDVTKLLFDDDIPRRERAEDTMSKVKYIPAPVREQLDASLQELEPPEMRPVYVLLRESGWRGTDILNIRYDNCLNYLWSEKEKEYVPYLCGEITKTGIPLLKIPIRPEVAEMVKELTETAKGQGTEENNPEHYLFNTYEGKNRGLPYMLHRSPIDRCCCRLRLRSGWSLHSSCLPGAHPR